MQRGVIAPQVDHDSRWWWEALAAEQLLLPRCDGCGRCFFPPQPTCPHCGNDSWQAVEASGRAVVYSWVVIHVALDATFAEDVPYTIVAAEFEEGPRVFGRLQNPDGVTAGEPLEAVFYKAGGTTFLGFERSGDAGDAIRQAD